MSSTVPDSADAGAFDAAGWAELIRDRVSEPRRLAAVAQTGLIESGLELVFDRLTQLAGAVLGTPWAFVTLVDDRRSFWKSCFGTGAITVADRQNRVEESFCQYVVATGEALLIDDARVDLRTKSNPSIASMGVIAWAGCPVRSASGEVLGTFCVVSDEVRHWTDDDAGVLETLAAAAASEIQLRTALQGATDTAVQLAEQLTVRDEMGRRSQLMADLAQELSAAESTIDISHIVSTTGRLVLDALYVNILTVDHAKGQMSTVHSPSVDADIIRRYSSLAIDELTPPGSAIVRGKPMVAETFADYSRQWPGVAADAAAVGVRSASAVPLFRSDGTIMGALSAGWDTEVEFAPLLRSTLSTLSRMAAAALERGQAGDARKGFVLALQHALLPVLPQLTGLDVAARYLPANSELGFGGDWYDIFAVTPTLSAVIVGDVCGHGIQAAATMAQLRGSINALVRINTDSLERVFDQAEDWLIGEPDFIATVAVHLIDTTQDIIHTVYAGHPPSVIVHADGRSEVLEAGRRPLLGAGGRPPVVGTAQFECGAVLVAFTDGLVERRGQNIDEGTDRVSDVVAAAAGGTCEQIAVSLEEAIDWVPTDDVAFAIVQRTTG